MLNVNGAADDVHDLESDPVPQRVSLRSGFCPGAGLARRHLWGILVGVGERRSAPFLLTANALVSAHPTSRFGTPCAQATTGASGEIVAVHDTGREVCTAPGRLAVRRELRAQCAPQHAIFHPTPCEKRHDTGKKKVGLGGKNCLLIAPTGDGCSDLGVCVCTAATFSVRSRAPRSTRSPACAGWRSRECVDSTNLALERQLNARHGPRETSNRAWAGVGAVLVRGLLARPPINNRSFRRSRLRSTGLFAGLGLGAAGQRPETARLRGSLPE